MKCRNCQVELEAESQDGLCSSCRAKAESTSFRMASSAPDKGDRGSVLAGADNTPDQPRGKEIWSSGDDQCVWPICVARAANGEILVLDSPDDFRILRFDTQGNCLGTLVEIPAEEDEGGVEDPQDLCVDSKGRLYVPDAGNDRISVFEPDGAFDSWIGCEGSLPGQFLHPSSAEVDADGFLYVADTYNYRIQRMSADGLVDLNLKQLDGWGSPQLLVAISVDGTGNIWIADAELNAVIKLASDGSVVQSLPAAQGDKSPFHELTDVQIDEQGVWYVGDERNQRVQRFDADGRITGLIDLRGEETPGSGVGNILLLEDRVVLADRQNDRILCMEFESP